MDVGASVGVGSGDVKNLIGTSGNYFVKVIFGFANFPLLSAGVIGSVDLDIGAVFDKATVNV